MSSSSSSLPPLPSLLSLIERYLHALEARGLAQGTIEHRRRWVREFFDWLLDRRIHDIRRVTPEDLAAYQKRLGANAHQRLGGLRHFFHWLAAERVLIADPTSFLILGRVPRRLPRTISEEEATRLLAAPDVRTPIGLRNRAILELLYGTGLRRAELAALDVADLDLGGGTVLVRSGKGGKSRVVPLGAKASHAVLDYLKHARPLWQRSPHATALFLAADRCGQTGQRLSRASIHLVVRQAAEAAGLRRVTAHMLRHALATHMLRAGAGVRHVQAILGHARLHTTEIYTHVAVRDLVKVHARCHPRGRRT